MSTDCVWDTDVKPLKYCTLFSQTVWVIRWSSLSPGLKPRAEARCRELLIKRGEVRSSHKLETVIKHCGSAKLHHNLTMIILVAFIINNNC